MHLNLLYSTQFLSSIHLCVNGLLWSKTLNIVATYQAVLGSLSSSVVGRPDFENLMKQEPASALLDALHVEKLGQRVSEEVFPDLEALELEMEINNLLLSYRPLKQVIHQISIPPKFQDSC